jgi:hypothetical protein
MTSASACVATHPNVPYPHRALVGRRELVLVEPAPLDVKHRGCMQHHASQVNYTGYFLDREAVAQDTTGGSELMV